MSRSLIGGIFVCALWPGSAITEHCGAGDTEETALMQRIRGVKKVARKNLRALLVVGQDDDVPLYADLVYEERLTVHGFQVSRIRDLNVTSADCEAYDVMAVSASIAGGNVGDRLNACTTPQIIWEVGILNANGMSGPGNDDAWVTSEWWNTYHQDSWEVTGYWPPAPTGATILITEEGAADPLAAGFKGEVPIFSVLNYGMNWANVNRIGKGAKVVAILPPDSTKDWPSASEPDVQKAVLFYYEKGSDLYAEGDSTPEKSPAFRIGFPPYNFYFGANPVCEELSGVPDCAECDSHCETAAQAMDADVNPTPLSCDGVKMLDAAIKVLKKKAHECKTTVWAGPEE